MFMFNLTIFIILGALVGAEWSPQHGTVSQPKRVGQWPSARPGDVVQMHDEQLYVANTYLALDGDIQMEALVPLTTGSFRNPKSLSDDIEQIGEVFFDNSTQEYKRSTCVGSTHECLESLQVSANWMSLLRDTIGDLPLGELALPGSHDAATEGCDLDSYLVDQTFLFGLAEEVAPQVVVNWSRTQEGDLQEQLEAGFRYYDLRIADMAAINETFFWWHGLTADTIFEGLEQIANFALSFPEEIVFLEFDHFAAMGDNESSTLPIPEDRLDELSDILLSYLGDVLVDQTQITSENPTINEVLATGRSIIAIVTNDYLRDKSDLFWTDIINYQFSGASNPEELFDTRSASLEDFRNNSPDRVTMISGCVTPNIRIVTAGLSIEFGDNPLLDRILDQIIPGVEVHPEEMSFEGLWTNLVTMARRGVNDLGMYSRDPESYSSGASIDYHGTNDIFRYWLARPDKYKPSIVFNDDVTGSSTLVEVAIQYNMGEIPREVSITYQGTPTHGFYQWENFTAVGGAEAYDCDLIDISIEIISLSYENIHKVQLYSEPFEMVFSEGEYPADSVVNVSVGSEGEVVPLWSGVIQDMIESNGDVHVRGASEGASGFAYIYEADVHPMHGPACDQTPDSGWINGVAW